MYRIVLRAPIYLALAFACSTSVGKAELEPEWIAELRAGSAFGAGLIDIALDPSGVSCATGVTGVDGNQDILTAAFSPEGALLWSRVYGGPGGQNEQPASIALGPGGVVYVAGYTLWPGQYSSVLLLEYAAATGELLDAIQFSIARLNSESAKSVVVDAQGNVFVGGVADVGYLDRDALIVAFDAAGEVRWQVTWDAPAVPHDFDIVQQLQFDPNGDLLALIRAGPSDQSDYAVVKIDPGDGSTIWEAIWDGGGEDRPIDMAIDGAGDVFVTGWLFDPVHRIGTIELSGVDGQLVWQAYDVAGVAASASAIALDGQGGVYVTGYSDPGVYYSSGDIYTFKRKTGDGALAWSHLYGSACNGCSDVPSDVAVDPFGHVFVGAKTSSPPYSGDLMTLVLDAATGVEIERGIVSCTSTTQTLSSGSLRFGTDYELLHGATIHDLVTKEAKFALVKYAAQ